MTNMTQDGNRDITKIFSIALFEEEEATFCFEGHADIKSASRLNRSMFSLVVAGKRPENHAFSQSIFFFLVTPPTWE